MNAAARASATSGTTSVACASCSGRRVVATPIVRAPARVARLDALRRVFEHDADLRLRAETLRGEREALGVRLAARYVFVGDDGVEVVRDAERAQDQVDVRARRR